MVTVAVKVTDETRAQLRAQAQARGEPLADYLRRQLSAIAFGPAPVATSTTTPPPPPRTTASPAIDPRLILDGLEAIARLLTAQRTESASLLDSLRQSIERVEALAASNHQSQMTALRRVAEILFKRLAVDSVSNFNREQAGEVLRKIFTTETP